jgi:N-methylhydantoinase A
MTAPALSGPGLRIGVDTGGTFTDAVVVAPDGRVAQGKSLSTPDDLTVGVLDAIAAAARDGGLGLREALAGAEVVAHATTVGINALLTGSGARVGLVTNAGFEATIPIARGNKVVGLDEVDRTEPVRWDKPPLLVPRSRIVGVSGRVDVHGEVLEPLDDDEVRALLAHLRDLGVESLAVGLLWSVVDPAHEERIVALASEVLPGVPVSASHRISRRVGEYERFTTTVLDAYVAPLVAGYVGRLGARLAAEGLRGRFVVTRSAGGAQAAAAVVRRPVDTLNSGPVGGVDATAALGARLGHRNVVATDVGGTSFDVGLVAGGRPQMAARPMVGRYPLATPVVDLTSIGTGGGSIAWIDAALGSLRVGPKSAGARPGPACYGRGGTRPTVTDAAVALGYLTHLAGGIELDVDAAQRAVARDIAGPLGLTVEQAADDILRVASSQMADLIRRATVQRGHDPAGFALYAYGGAAGQHVGRYAAEVGAACVVVPALASVFSARGAAGSVLRAEAALDRTPLDLRAATATLAGDLAGLEARAWAELAGTRPDGAGTGDAPDESVTVDRWVSMRFARQTQSVRVACDASPGADALEAAFRAEYERLVGEGTAQAGEGVEVVAVEVEVALTRGGGADEPTDVVAAGATARARTRRAWFAGGWHDGAVLAVDDLPIGSVVAGPVFVEPATTTVVVHPGQGIERLSGGDLLVHLTLVGGPS